MDKLSKLFCLRELNVSALRNKYPLFIKLYLNIVVLVGGVDDVERGIFDADCPYKSGLKKQCVPDAGER